jgi:hypothetical protein
MPVVRQYLRDPLVPHRLHGDAVGQAIPLIGAGLVQGQSGEEGLVRLLPDEDVGVGLDAFDLTD